MPASFSFSCDEQSQRRFGQRSDRSCIMHHASCSVSASLPSDILALDVLQKCSGHSLPGSFGGPAGQPRGINRIVMHFILYSGFPITSSSELLLPLAVPSPRNCGLPASGLEAGFQPSYKYIRLTDGWVLRSLAGDRLPLTENKFETTRMAGVGYGSQPYVRLRYPEFCAP